MNKDIKQVLRSLGMQKEEIDIYLAGIELGEISMQNLAKKAGVKRSSAYKVMESLQNKGMFYQTFKGKKRFFVAEDPKKLQSTLQQKELELSKVLPELQSIYNLLPAKPKIKYYEGIAGAMAIYDDTLKSTEENGTILTYTSIKNLFKIFPENYTQEYFKKRMQKNIKTKVIAIDSTESRQWKYNATKELREIFIVSEDKFNFFGDTEIYGNKIAIISYKENFMAMVIESVEIANMQRFIFDLAWSGLENSHSH